MRVQRLATAPVFAETRKVWGGEYLPHHCSDWSKILDLVLWVPKQHVYQVSLKSETVGFKFSVILGDLTRNDPNVFYSGVDIQTLCECISRELDKLHVWLSVNKLS